MEYTHSLTPKAEQEAKEWLSTKGIKPVCPICGSSNTGPLGFFKQHLAIKKPSLAIETLTVVCADCTYLMHFAYGLTASP